MPLDPEFLQMLACPACATALRETPDGRLLCSACRRSFPVRDDIPILLLDEARLEEETDSPASQSER